VLTFKTDQVVFTSEQEIPWTVDGENGGAYTCSRVTNQARALQVIRGKKK
jgi:hypothetical protein